MFRLGYSDKKIREDFAFIANQPFDDWTQMDWETQLVCTGSGIHIKGRVEFVMTENAKGQLYVHQQEEEDGRGSPLWREVYRTNRVCECMFFVKILEKMATIAKDRAYGAN